MTTSSHDLQATHQILTLLENSKERIDDILDYLKGIFAIIDSEGKIYKSNLKLAELLECTLEDAFNQNFFNLFRKETSAQFANYLSHASPRVGIEDHLIQFELNLNHTRFSEEKIYYWEVTQFGTFKTENTVLYTIVGRDITDLRRTEKQLSEIFSNIPIGIMTISEGGIIDEQYSLYLEWIFGRQYLAFQNIKEILIEPSWNHLSEKNQKGFCSLLESLGQPEFVFDSSVNMFPRQIFYTYQKSENPKAGLYLNLSYHPFVYDGTVKRLLLIVENVTELVLLKEAEQKDKEIHHRIAQRILELKNSQNDILSLCMNENINLFQRLGTEILNGEGLERLKSTLHGIKGNSRIAGLKTLADMCHGIETELTNTINTSAKSIQTQIKEMISEWEEIHQLYIALYSQKEGGPREQAEDKVKQVKDLFHRYRDMLITEITPQSMIMVERLSLALTNLNSVPIASIFPILELNISKTAESLNKQVKINITSHQEEIDEEIRSILLECLNHILSNAVAHGIELPEDRIKKGKMAQGNVQVIFSQNLGRINCKIVDDGAGFNIDKIRRILVRKRLITLSEAQSLSDAKVIEWIFQPDFSTTENVNEISGRGVGLSAVLDSLKSVNGSVVAFNNTESAVGATFEISLRAYKDIPYERRAISVSSLVEKIDDQMRLLSASQYCSCDTASLLNKQLKGIILCDPMKLILGITTIVAKFATGHKTIIEGSVHPFEGYINFKIKKNGRLESAKPLEAEYYLVEETCLEYLSGHGGQIKRVEDESELEINFGVLLDHLDLPIFYLAKPKDISENSFEEIHKHMAKSLEPLGLVVSNLDPDNDKMSFDKPQFVIGLNEKNDFSLQPISPHSSQQEIQQVSLGYLEKIFLK